MVLGSGRPRSNPESLGAFNDPTDSAAFRGDQCLPSVLDAMVFYLKKMWAPRISPSYEISQCSMFASKQWWLMVVGSLFCFGVGTFLVYSYVCHGGCTLRIYMNLHDFPYQADFESKSNRSVWMVWNLQIPSMQQSHCWWSFMTFNGPAACPGRGSVPHALSGCQYCRGSHKICGFDGVCLSSQQVHCSH